MSLPIEEIVGIWSNEYRSTSLRLTDTISIQENKQLLAYQHVCISNLHLTCLNIATYEAPLKSSTCGCAIIRKQCAKPMNPKLKNRKDPDILLHRLAPQMGVYSFFSFLFLMWVDHPIHLWRSTLINKLTDKLT